MRACLSELLPGTEPVFFPIAREMISWLGEHLGDAVLISLDHDLPISRQEGRTVDCGSGREVADFLASMAPTCPVIVHSSNGNCAPGMYFVLKGAGWPCTRVYPSDDTSWITHDWAGQIERYLAAGWIRITREGRE